jgi:hypothetical protein
MDYSDDEVDHLNDVEEYIPGTVQTTPKLDLKTQGPQTRFRKRVDEACRN